VIDMEIHRQLQRNRLAGAVAVVAGIAEPAGSAIARRFAAEGARLVVAATGGGAARETMHEIEGMGGTALFIEADARTDAGARRIAAAAIERYSRIDTLVHCLDVRAAPGEGGVDVDLAGFFPMVFASASTMSLQGEGSIVLAALVRDAAHAGLDPLGQATARAGLGSFVHAAATGFYGQGITVNAVALEDLAAAGPLKPGEPRAAHLNFVNAYRKARRFEDVAQAARFLASSEARGITGQVLYVGGGAAPDEPACALSPQHLHRIESVYRDLFAHFEVASL
jgi:3-oxoacyl-[acyl-carrier protein] reductase